MRGLINLAIAETNTAFFLSGATATQLCLAHHEPNYVEHQEEAKDGEEE